MLLYKNKFFKDKMELKNFSQLTFNQTFKGFREFLLDDSFLHFDKRIVSRITTGGTEEYVYFQNTLRKEIIAQYNKQMIENLFNFYEPAENEKKINSIFKKNDELTNSQLEKALDKYFSPAEGNPELEGGTIIKVTSFNEQLVFFIKKILGDWVLKQNKEMNEKKIFFPGKGEENLEVQLIQDVYINEGLKKTFSINYKMETPNYKINAELIKQIYYNDLGVLDFFNLNENFKKVIKKNHKDNKEGLQFYFGNLYFVLNTKQTYIINDLMNLLLTIGINSFEIPELPELDDRENYLTMSLLQLFKLNLGYQHD